MINHVECSTEIQNLSFSSLLKSVLQEKALQKVNNWNTLLQDIWLGNSRSKGSDT